MKYTLVLFYTLLQTTSATVRGIRTDELDRLKSYHLQSDLVSNRERRRRDTGEYEYVRSGHHYINIIINEKEEILDLYEDKDIHPDDLNCKFYSGKIRGDEEHSKVALSNCQTWQGLIYSGKWRKAFILEPISGTNQHIIYDADDDTRIFHKEIDLTHDHPEEDDESERLRRSTDESSAYANLKNDYLETETLDRSKRAQRSSRRRTGIGARKYGRRGPGGRGQESSADEEYTINVLIAIDDSIMKFHGDESDLNRNPDNYIPTKLVNYIKTLIHIVNNIYKDDTLTSKVNVNMIALKRIPAEESRDLVVKDNPTGTLDNVSHLLNHSKRYRRGVSPEAKPDVTVFLTRSEFGPAGYAPVARMCQGYTNTINREEGFSSAFVIAHEVGHILGMKHDGVDNACTDDPGLGSIMAPVVQAKLHRYSWSRCSNNELKDVIKNYECLKKKPVKSLKQQDQKYTRNITPIGPNTFSPIIEKGKNEMYNYTLDEQCQFAFGNEFSWCDTITSENSECQDIWCSERVNPTFCKSKHSAPLDGTKCNMQGGGVGFCFKAQCLAETASPNRINQDGEWTTWTEWGQCSAVCGTGTKTRRRNCVGKKGNGNPCIGKTVDYIVCNTHECKNNIYDRRTHMCQQETGNNLMVPRIDRNTVNQCKLHCWDYQNKTVAKHLGDLNVPDGTPCSYDAPHGAMCIMGQCVAAGCDKKIGQEAIMTADECGICGGGGRSCRTIRGNFKQNIKHSSKRRKRLITVTTIVAGAYDFDLSFVCSKCSSRKTNRYTNMLKKDIHLKFVDKKTGFIYELGHRLLDGNRIERNPDQVVIGGSLLRRKSNGKRRPPIYSIKGGLLNDIDVKIEASARGRKRTRVELDWTFKIKEGTKMPQKGAWKPQRWSKCLTQRGTRSDSCQGYKKQIFECRNAMGQIERKKSVALDVCGPKPKAQTNKCIITGCKATTYEWRKTSDWSPCSVTCGYDGRQYREAVCVDSKGTPVAEALCNHLSFMFDRPCRQERCPAEWVSEPWDKNTCTATSPNCGGNGHKTRAIFCKRGENQIAEEYCNHLRKPATSEPCTVPCKIVCEKDQSVFCGVMYLKEYCRTEDFRKLCCLTCDKYGSDPEVLRSIESDDNRNENNGFNRRSPSTAGGQHSTWQYITPLNSNARSPDTYSMNEEFDDDYDDMDDMGTPPLSDRRRRSAPKLPQFHWTLEKLNEIGEELMADGFV